MDLDSYLAVVVVDLQLDMFDHLEFEYHLGMFALLVVEAVVAAEDMLDRLDLLYNQVLYSDLHLDLTDQDLDLDWIEDMMDL